MMEESRPSREEKMMTITMAVHAAVSPARSAWSGPRSTGPVL